MMQFTMTDKSFQRYFNLRKYLGTTPPNQKLVAPHAKTQFLAYQYFKVKLNRNFDFNEDQHGLSLTLFQICALYGLTDHIEDLLKALQGQPRITAVKADNYAAIHFAVMNGFISTVKHLISLVKQYQTADELQNQLPFFIASAARYGHLDLLIYLKSLSVRNKTVTEMAHALSNAARGNHLSIVEYLTHPLPLETIRAIVRNDNYLTIRSAARGGHISMIETLTRFLPQNEKHDATIKSLASAAASGEMNTFAYLLAHLSDEEKKLHAGCMKTLEHVAQGGNLDILCLLKPYWSNCDDKIEKIIYYATYHGHLPLIQYLFPHLKSKRRIATALDCIQPATQNEQLHVLRFLIHFLNDARLSQKENKTLRHHFSQALTLIVENNTIELLQYLLGRLIPKEINAVLQAEQYKLLNLASQHDDKTMYNYLLSYVNLNSDDSPTKSVVTLKQPSSCRENLFFYKAKYSQQQSECDFSAGLTFDNSASTDSSSLGGAL